MRDQTRPTCPACGQPLRTKSARRRIAEANATSPAPVAEAEPADDAAITDAHQLDESDGWSHDLRVRLRTF